MIRWIMDVLKEFNDSPKDFIKHALIVLLVLTIWGLFMGGELR